MSTGYLIACAHFKKENMKKASYDLPILIVAAFLWDGKQQLAGKLILYPNAIRFYFKDFQKSLIELNIPIEKINGVEEFLLFGLDRMGLKINSNFDSEDLFISEKSKLFKKELDKVMQKSKS
jgi:hypothetical protein